MKSEYNRELLHAVIQSAETLNSAHFISTLTDDASFRFGSGQIIEGKENIKKSVDLFFNKLSGLEHRVLAVGETPEVLFYEGEITYRLKSGQTLTLPYCNVLHLKDGLVHDFRIYVDRNPMNS